MGYIVSYVMRFNANIRAWLWSRSFFVEMPKTNRLTPVASVVGLFMGQGGISLQYYLPDAQKRHLSSASDLLRVMAGFVRGF